MSTATNSFPDGCLQPPTMGDAGGRLSNPAAPEELAPQLHGEDTGWVAIHGSTTQPPAPGLQPKTANNPNGDYAGVSPMSPTPPRTWC